MTVTVELIGQALAAIVILVTAFWALAKVIVAQFKEHINTKFAAMEESRKQGQQVWNSRMEQMEVKTNRLDEDVRKILIELPREYVNRSDYVRRETVIEAKIDQLWLRIQNAILEKNNGS